MLHVQRIDDVTVVSGYDDGTAWFIDGGPWQGVFGPGGALLWQFRAAEIRIVDLAARSIIGAIPLELRLPEGARAVGSVGGSRLWVLAPSPVAEGAAPADAKGGRLADLIAVDLDRRTVVGKLPDQPLSIERDAAVMADGSLLLASMDSRDGQAVDLITRVGWDSLDISESFVPVRRIPNTYKATHWHARSPDGRWWLRFDHTSFPTVERSPAPGTPPRVYYGVTMQLWSAYPLRFERRIVVYWLKAEDLPDDTGIFRPWDIPQASAPPAPPPSPAPIEPVPLLQRVFGRRGATPPPPTSAPPPPSISPHEAAMLASVPERDRIYSAISRALNRPELSPDAPFPERAEFGEEAGGGDALWDAITRNLGVLLERSGPAIGWDDDHDAVWLDRVGFMVRVQMDGAVSPQLWCERFGLNRGAMKLAAEKAEIRLPLPDRGLLAVMPPREAIGFVSEAREGGAMVIDGSPAEPRYEPVMIPQGADGWIPGGEAIPAHILNREAYRKTIARAKLERSVVRVPVKGADAASRAEAIAHLAWLIGPDFFARAADHEIDIVFVIDGKDVREGEFFSSIGLGDREWALPALRLVVGRYIDANSGFPETWYQPDGEGDSVLAHAVLRLAQIDRQSLPLIRAFGQKIDGGHEYFFAGTIVPAVIEAHGWTQDVIEFVFWVLLYNFYNTYDKISTVWRDLGLHRAVSTARPEDVAAFVASAFAPSVARGELSWDAMAVLRRELGDAADRWENRFFEELARLAPGSVTAVI